MFVRLDGAEADGRPSYGFKRSGGERGRGLVVGSMVYYLVSLGLLFTHVNANY